MHYDVIITYQHKKQIVNYRNTLKEIKSGTSSTGKASDILLENLS